MSKIKAMTILITSGILKLRDTSILSLAVFMVIIGDLIRAFNRLLHHCANAYKFTDKNRNTNTNTGTNANT